MEYYNLSFSVFLGELSMRLKLSCQENLGLGETIEARCNMLAELGFEAVEIWGKDLIRKPETVDKLSNTLERKGLKVSVILVGYRGSLLAFDKQDRENAFEDISQLLEIAGRLKAVGLIVVPIFGQPELPDLSPMMNVIELQDKLLVEYLKELGPVAKSANTNLILEPLNRGETRYLNTIEHAVRLIDAANVEGLATMGDLFHMNIEERNVTRAIRDNHKHIVHIHLADNTRLEPGSGMIDFKVIFDTLKDIGYSNYVSLECGFSLPDRKQALTKTVEFLKPML